MSTIDHTNTFALLVGASSFPKHSSISDIPNVKVNIEELKRKLIDCELIGIPIDNIITSINEEKSIVVKKIIDITRITRDKKYTLFIYYSGHGLISSNDREVYLATHSTTPEYLEEDSININYLRKRIQDSFAGRKIVILDSCYSGSIIGSMSDMNSFIQNSLNEFEGTYVMTSSAQNMTSLYPINEPHNPSYFTKQFLDVIDEGANDELQYSTLRDIYNKIKNAFIDRNLPIPQQSNFNNADQLLFSKNAKYNHKKKEDNSWLIALEENKIIKYKYFIDTFPHSVYASLAKEKISYLEECECWQKAINKKANIFYQAYIEEYPLGIFAEEAREFISATSSQNDSFSNTIKNDEILSWEKTIVKYVDNKRFFVENSQLKIRIPNLGWIALSISLPYLFGTLYLLYLLFLNNKESDNFSISIFLIIALCMDILMFIPMFKPSYIVIDFERKTLKDSYITYESEHLNCICFTKKNDKRKWAMIFDHPNSRFSEIDIGTTKNEEKSVAMAEILELIIRNLKLNIKIEERVTRE